MKMKSLFITILFLIAVVIKFSAAYPNAGLLNTSLPNTSINVSEHVGFLKNSSIHKQPASKYYKNGTLKEIKLKEKLSTTLLTKHTQPIPDHERVFKTHAIGEEEKTKELQNQAEKLVKKLRGQTMKGAQKHDKEGINYSDELKKMHKKEHTKVGNKLPGVKKVAAEVFVTQDENKEKHIKGLNKQAAKAIENITLIDQHAEAKAILAKGETGPVRRSINNNRDVERQISNLRKKNEEAEKYSETKLDEGSKNQKLTDLKKQNRQLIFLSKEVVDKNTDSLENQAEKKAKGFKKQKREVKPQEREQIEQHEIAEWVSKHTKKEETLAEKEGKLAKKERNPSAQRVGKYVTGLVKGSRIEGEQTKEEVGTNTVDVEKLAKGRQEPSEKSRKIGEVKNKVGRLNKLHGKGKQVKEVDEPAGEGDELAKTEMKPPVVNNQQNGVHKFDFSKQLEELGKQAERNSDLAGGIEKSLHEKVAPTGLKKYSIVKRY